MKSTGVIRTVDKMGRVVIPREIRKQLNIEDNVDQFEIYMEDDKVVLKKHTPACLFCNSIVEIVNFGDYKVCKNCIEKLNELKSKL